MWQGIGFGAAILSITLLQGVQAHGHLNECLRVYIPSLGSFLYVFINNASTQYGEHIHFNLMYNRVLLTGLVLSPLSCSIRRDWYRRQIQNSKPITRELRPSLLKDTGSKRYIYNIIPLRTDRIRKCGWTARNHLGTMSAVHKSGGDQLQWDLLGCPHTELRLEYTMPTGQSFRWVNLKDDELYVGVIGCRVVRLSIPCLHTHHMWWVALVCWCIEYIDMRLMAGTHGHLYVHIHQMISTCIHHMYTGAYQTDGIRRGI